MLIRYEICEAWPKSSKPVCWRWRDLLAAMWTPGRGAARESVQAAPLHSLKGTHIVRPLASTDHQRQPEHRSTCWPWRWLLSIINKQLKNTMTGNIGALGMLAVIGPGKFKEKFFYP